MLQRVDRRWRIALFVIVICVPLLRFARSPLGNADPAESKNGVASGKVAPANGTAPTRLALDPSQPGSAEPFAVPGYELIECIQRPATYPVPGSEKPWSMKAFYDPAGRLVGLEYVKDGQARPKIDMEFSREAYERRDQAVKGLSGLDLTGHVDRLLARLFDRLPPDEVRFFKMATVLLERPTGDDAVKPVGEPMILVIVYSPNLLGSNSDGARTVYTPAGEGLFSDNVFGGE